MSEGGSARKRPPRRRRRRSRGKRPPLERTVEAARSVAQRRFRVARMHDEQERALEGLFEGRDVVAVLPTGFGKSLVYQVAAVLTDRPTLVISPLIALMSDQEQKLKKANVPVIRLDSTIRAAERRAALERLEQGGSLVVLTTPETLESQATGPLIAAAKPWLLCVDEAHCISEWGHDFRPAYLRLGAVCKTLGGPQVLALTATATPTVRENVMERLAMTDPLVVMAPPYRPNLRLEAEVVTVASKPIRAGKLIRKLKRPGIVYCATTVETESVYKALSAAKIPCARYHGRMKKDERDEAQRQFMQKRPTLMVATNAFGMGIDKPDIRFILHYQAPGSLEQYVQEAGRAGRDGKPSRCILLFDSDDMRIQTHLQSKGRPSPQQLRRVTEALMAWAEEGRTVSSDDLALSAGSPKTTTRAMCAELEAIGMLEVDENKEYRVLVDAKRLREGAEDLARRFETLRKEDKARREALVEYASSIECRSVMLRRWFGEEFPPPCGVCDRCTDKAAPGTTYRRKRNKKKAGRKKAGAQAAAGTSKKRRRRRRSKSGGARPAGSDARPDDPPGVAPTAVGEDGQPKRRRRRGKRRRRRKAAGTASTDGAS